MAKRRYGIDSAKRERYIREGRGTGTGADYKPWLTIQDVPSEGRVHRPFGWTTKRVHHLLSDIEYRHFLLLDWAEAVTDIREQFPLDLARTQTIAEEAGIAHPREPGTGDIQVMTTDFLCVVENAGGRRLFAWAIKPAAKLDDPRVVEKLEIERRYWKAQGDIEWHISTERELNADRVEALDWMYGCWDLEGIKEPRYGFIGDAKFRIASAVSSDAYRTIPLNDACTELDARSNCMEGTHLMVARHLLARRVLVSSAQTKLWQAEMGALSLREKAFHEVTAGGSEGATARHAA
ncbi:TnsA endonuclease N-terminal domain-containing protein [Paraburkholderia tagetis]|uniref:TnsA endonuclease N-terminal domain-containing protein n=1 Tax=Paraburkholderia tagetis TaxID=2913261 RepID=A0A9X1RQ52_9BURK|nr:TnsA endonuclease N-terminal domain-containing protein [Paraburkholderia tagetis]